MKKLKIIFGLLAIGLVSCSDDNDSSNSEAETLSSGNSFESEVAIETTENVLDDISMYSESVFGVDRFSETNKEANSAKTGTWKHGKSGYFKDCAEIVVVEEDDVRTTTITFTDDCLDRNGNVIVGKITKVSSVTDEDSERTVTVDSLSINGYVVNGTKKYTYTASNANGNPERLGSIDITVETDEGVIFKEGTKVVEITAGGDTDTYFDDEKTITGSYVYTNADGTTFNTEITTALVKPAECRYIASGVKEYTDADGLTVLDYGDGTCDNVATKTIPDGTVTEVELGKRRFRKNK